MSNLFDVARFPAHQFGDLYHQRWRIEESFKRLKHRLSLEHVSGLSQQAVAQDVAAKVLCDNLQALTALSARDKADLPESVRINHAYVHSALKPLLPALLLGKKVAKHLRDVLRRVAQNTFGHRENLSKPRKARPKPHKYMTQKHCGSLPDWLNLGGLGGDCAQGAGLLGFAQLAIGCVEGARGDPGAVSAGAVGGLRCSVVGLQACQAGPVYGVKDGVGELARSVPALEAHFLGDVAFAVVEVARPDAAVFVGVAAPAVAVEVVPAVAGRCAALAWAAWDGDCSYEFNSFLRTFYLGWRLV